VDSLAAHLKQPRRRRTVALAVALASAGAGSIAGAAPPPVVPKGLEAAAALLDARAPIFAAIHPTDLGDGFALMELVSGIFPDATRALVRLRDGLGFYALSSGELKESGVDPNAPVLASFGLADADDGGGGKRAARAPFVRHRFVVKRLDDERFQRAALAVLSANKASTAVFGGDADDGDGSGFVPTWTAAREVQALVKRAKVALLARTKDGALVAIRYVGDFAVIDYADPAKGAGGRARSESRAATVGLLARMLEPPRQPLAATLAQGTRPLLATLDVSLAVVLQPKALGPLFARPSCARDLAAPEDAFFDDTAVLLRLHPFQWRVEVAWSLTAVGRTRLAGAATDDGLLDGRAVAADGVAAAGLLLDRFQSIGEAPRPPVLAGSLDRASGAIDACGPLGWLAAAARYWPQLAALQIEKLGASLAPKGAPAPTAVLDGLRNVAAVVRRLPGSGRGWDQTTVIVGSLPTTAEPAVSDALARRASGHPETQSFGERLPTFFDLSAATGFSEAGLERIAGGHLALALTPEASGLGWYYRLPRRPARLGPQSKIGYLHVNLAHLLSSWAASADASTRAAVRLAAGQLGQLGGNLVVDGNLLRLDMSLATRQ
jgi:hypothetical protein